MARKAQTAAAPPSRVSSEIILKFAGLLSGAKERLDTANGEYRAIVKNAKAAGCNSSVLLDTLRKKKRDLDQVNVDLRDEIYYRDILGLPVEQKWLFGNPVISSDVKQQVTVQDAEGAGFAAGKSGGARGDNLHKAGSDMFVAWDRGYGRGQEAIAKEMAGGGRTKTASTRKGREADPALPLAGGEAKSDPPPKTAKEKKAAKAASGSTNGSAIGATNGAANGAGRKTAGNGTGRGRGAQHGGSAERSAADRVAN